MSGLRLLSVSVGSMDNRCYLLVEPASGGWLLVDAAAEPGRLLALLQEVGAAVEPGRGLVVTTHRHHDHVGALVEVAGRTGAVTASGADDADALPLAPDRRLRHGDTVSVGASDLEVVALRGHTPGSVALLLPAGEVAGGVTDGVVGGSPPQLFTGDSLFPGGPGRTGTPADFASLMADLTERVFAPLGDDVVVLPGHGEPTTLGAERPHLAQWRARGW